jgi:hypothetical protein
MRRQNVIAAARREVGIFMTGNEEVVENGDQRPLEEWQARVIWEEKLPKQHVLNHSARSRR